MLYRWEKEKNKDLIKYSVSAIWKKPRCEDNCYFCMNDVEGFNVKNKHKIFYSTVISVTKPN